MKDPITLLLKLFGYKYNTRDSLLFNHMIETTHGNWHTRMFNNGTIEKYKYDLYSK